MLLQISLFSCCSEANRLRSGLASPSVSPLIAPFLRSVAFASESSANSQKISVALRPPTRFASQIPYLRLVSFALLGSLHIRLSSSPVGEPPRPRYARTCGVSPLGSGASSLRFCFVAGAPPRGAEPTLSLVSARTLRAFRLVKVLFRFALT